MTRNRHCRKRWILLPALLFLFVMNVTMTAAGAGRPDRAAARNGKKTPSPAGGYITMNFTDADLRILIKFISELTGKNFLVDPRVKGKVTILSPKKVTIDEAYRVFLSVLEINGYTAVPAGRIIKILPSAAARAKGIQTRRGTAPPSKEDKVITQLVPLTHADADGLAKLLRPLVPKTGLMIAYRATNTLIIIDTLSNVNRLVRIIGELDVAVEREEIRVFFLKNARAADLAPMLLKLLQKRRGKQASTDLLKIMPDKRTNALVLLAAPRAAEKIEKLIRELDREQARPRENIHIYSLKNAVAEDIAKVLREIPGKSTGGRKGKAPVISGNVRISADKATNSLVIIAEPDEYQSLAGIIRKLDIPRTMVYVEALIMEVSTTRSLDLGVEWRVGNEYNGGFAAGEKGGVWFGGSTGKDASLNALAGGTLPPGFAAGVIGRAIKLGNVTFPSIGAFIKATRTDSDFNIISTPQILTLDNEEASIEVGQTIPFVTSIDQTTTAATDRVQTYEYKDVGVSLKVTPHINQSGSVRLQVEESVKSVIQSTAEVSGGTVLAPTTAFRTAKTNITIRDGETVVIGGLIENRISRGKTQTPCLGNMPLAGWLFKTTSDRDEKTNLLVFLTPHIIRNPEQTEKIRSQKQEEMNGAMKKSKAAGRSEKLREMLRK